MPLRAKDASDSARVAVIWRNSSLALFSVVLTMKCSIDLLASPVTREEIASIRSRDGHCINRQDSEGEAHLFPRSRSTHLTNEQLS